MEYNAKWLLRKIDDYFAGVISKTDLGEWANNAYYDLLKGGYVENEKISVYPFIKTVSTFHIKENDKDDIYPCTEDNVKVIQDILRGKRNFDFAVEISVPIQVYSMFKGNICFDEEKYAFFFQLRNLIACYIQDNIISDEISAQIASMMCLKRQNKVILDLLEEYILRFLSILFENNLVELGLQKNLKLYAQRSEKNIIAKRLIDYLDCYLGNRNFQLLIAYKSGESSIFITV